MPNPTPIVHTAAAILSIGDELVRGQTLDTNSKWLSAALMDLGIETIEHVTIPDDRALNTETFRRLASRAPLIICTGGLGPTADDLTRDALADALGEDLIVDDRALRDLESKFAARGRTLNPLQRAQATRPRSARCLDNPLGTAPGLHARLGDTDIVCLPGPPGELQPMFRALVVPMLRTQPGVIVRTRILHMIGIGEGDAAKLSGDLMRRDRNPLVGITASGAVVSWRIRYRGPGPEDTATAALDADERTLRAAMGQHIFGCADDTLPAAMLRALRQRSQTLAVVESCTGGMLGQMLTDVPGSSAAFGGGLITYSNDLKTSLAGVPSELIAAHGAVSAEVALAMARGGLERLGADHALAITGIAGPDGATSEKPVGTVWIALASGAGPGPRADVRRFRIPGSRHDVRERAARQALGMLHFALAGAAPGSPAMLFQSHP